MTPEVGLLSTGVANVASIRAGLERAGARVRSVESPSDAANCNGLVLPGVGRFSAGLEALRSRRLDVLVRESAAGERPLLAICLGLQLLFEESEECPGVAGLSLVPGRVRTLPTDVVRPHMGWNVIRPQAPTTLLREGSMYFANGFAIRTPPPGVGWASCDHGGEFVAALERPGLLGCQFHPELSGTAGAELLGRWVGTLRSEEMSTC